MTEVDLYPRIKKYNLQSEQNSNSKYHLDTDHLETERRHCFYIWPQTYCGSCILDLKNCKYPLQAVDGLSRPRFHKIYIYAD